MNITTIDNTLKEHHIRPTGIRRAILNIFQKNSFALSHAKIAGELSDTFDRVTIYRTLNKFVEGGLIHKVVDESNITKFALCNDSRCDNQTHNDNHVHFKCWKCGHTFCLNSITITLPNLPSGYQYNDFMVIVDGICKDCSLS